MENVLFSTSVFKADLEAIPVGAPLAVLSLALTMEDVLLRSKFEEFRRFAGFRCGSVKIDWVYNFMPPVAGQVVPEVELQAVKEF